MSDDRTTTPSIPLPALATPLPTLAIADADGIRRTVTGIDTTTTVGALADLLGIAGHRSVTIDGRPVPRTVGLARTGIVQGSTVRPGVADDVDLMARRKAVSGARRAARSSGRPSGPPRRDASAPVRSRSSSSRADRRVCAPVALAAGRHVVGRAAGAAVRLLDERAELHHGVLDIDGAGVRFTQLTGRTPCDVGGPAEAAHAERRTFAVGASRISVRPAGGAATAAATLRAHPADPWRRTLHRAPRHHPRWVTPPVDVPAGDRRSTSPRPAGLLAMAGADARRRRGRRRPSQPDVPRALRCRRAGGAGDPPRRPGDGSPSSPSWFGRTPPGGGAVHQRARGSSPGAGGVRARDHADDR